MSVNYSVATPQTDHRTQNTFAHTEYTSLVIKSLTFRTCSWIYRSFDVLRHSKVRFGLSEHTHVCTTNVWRTAALARQIFCDPLRSALASRRNRLASARRILYAELPRRRQSSSTPRFPIASTREWRGNQISLGGKQCYGVAIP